MDLGDVHDGDSVRLLGKQIRVQAQPLLDVLEHVADHQTPRVTHTHVYDPSHIQVIFTYSLWSLYYTEV